MVFYFSNTKPMAPKKAEVKIEEVKIEKIEAPKKAEVKKVVPAWNIVWAKEKWGLLLKWKTYEVSKEDFERIKHLVK